MEIHQRHGGSLEPPLAKAGYNDLLPDARWGNPTDRPSISAQQAAEPKIALMQGSRMSSRFGHYSMLPVPGGRALFCLASTAEASTRTLKSIPCAPIWC